MTDLILKDYIVVVQIFNHLHIFIVIPFYPMIGCRCACSGCGGCCTRQFNLFTAWSSPYTPTACPYWPVKLDTKHHTAPLPEVCFSMTTTKKMFCFFLSHLIFPNIGNLSWWWRNLIHATLRRLQDWARSLLRDVRYDVLAREGQQVKLFNHCVSPLLRSGFLSGEKRKSTLTSVKTTF